MVNVPALAGAVQAAKDPTLKVLSVALATSISTCPVEPFGFQLTVSPLERVTESPFGFGLRYVGVAGIVKVALIGPTSGPPLLVIV
jgi:hypothetical protein